MTEVFKVIKRNQTHVSKDAAQDNIKKLSDVTAISPPGWISPQYTISKTVTIDYDIATSHYCISLLSDAKESEYYKMLRTQLRQKLEAKGWNTLMVTSVNPGEGKTVSAINLAAVFAMEYAKTVLLVDVDFYKQSIHRYLGYEQAYGLSEYLLENVPLQDIIVWPQIEKLTIISGGKILKNGSELINSPRMKRLVQDMKQRYSNRYIFFDVPALSSGADALAFTPLVDGILVVVEAGKTPMPEIKKHLALLPKEKVVGLVMNRAE